MILRKNDSSVAKIVNTRLTQIFMAIFAPDERLPTSALPFNPGHMRHSAYLLIIRYYDGDADGDNDDDDNVGDDDADGDGDIDDNNGDLSLSENKQSDVKHFLPIQHHHGGGLNLLHRDHLHPISGGTEQQDPAGAQEMRHHPGNLA